MHYVHRIFLSLHLFAPYLLHAGVTTVAIPRPDESEIVGYFYTPQNCTHFPIMIVCQGSYVHKQTVQSCKPLFDKMVENFTSVPIGILAIEKRGSYHDCCDRAVFDTYNTVTNRINDNITAIQALATICDGWDGKLILVGGSEGTFVASALAQQLQDRVTALILFAGGGSRPFKEEFLTEFVNQPWYIRWYIRLFVGSEEDIKEQLRIMQEDPTPTKMWGGQTYQLWADLANRSLADIFTLTMPIFYMMGTEDERFQCGKKLQAVAEQMNNRTITFAWYSDLGHIMGDAFDMIMQDTKAWLKTHTQAL